MFFELWALIFSARLSRLSATIVLRTAAGKEIDWAEPTVRNSNLFPVNAKGDVRFRSVVSLPTMGNEEIPRSMISLSVAFVTVPFFDVVQYLGQLVAEEDGDDGRRRLVGAKAVIVGV